MGPLMWLKLSTGFNALLDQNLSILSHFLQCLLKSHWSQWVSFHCRSWKRPWEGKTFSSPGQPNKEWLQCWKHELLQLELNRKAFFNGEFYRLTFPMDWHRRGPVKHTKHWVTLDDKLPMLMARWQHLPMLSVAITRSVQEVELPSFRTFCMFRKRLIPNQNKMSEMGNFLWKGIWKVEPECNVI